MELLALRTNGLQQLKEGLPFAVYTVGTEIQTPITRLEGFSAHQLFIVFAGTGRFRLMGQNKWDILAPGSLLYIPARTPNEYMPAGEEPWFVGYVTYLERDPGLLSSWGFGREAFVRKLDDMAPLYGLIRRMWRVSGPHCDAWLASKLLFAFCLEAQKQLHKSSTGDERRYVGFAAEDPTDAVSNVIRFMHDHLERKMKIGDLAAYVGYSQKQLTRMFRQALNTTPLQYLQKVRLRTAELLLSEHPDMTVRQAAFSVGMEPVYFGKLFRRAYGRSPSEGRNGRFSD